MAGDQKEPQHLVAMPTPAHTPPPILIASLGVEGGGADIYACRADSGWEFWLDGSTIYLDENDIDGWRSWTSEPATDLFTLLPSWWWSMIPIMIHPEFRDQFRREYELCRAAPGVVLGREWQHERWLRLFAETQLKLDL